MNTDQSGYICIECIESVEPADGQRCAFCMSVTTGGVTCAFCKKSHSLDRLLVAADYSSRLVELVAKTLKYRFVPEVAGNIADVINKRFVKTIKQIKQEYDPVVIMPIPLHKNRMRWRGFNQAELIAKKLSEYWDIPIMNEIIMRKRNIAPQADIKDRNSRIKNAEGIFAVNTDTLVDAQNAITGASILLIDDLSTTGSTLNEAAKVLKTLGASRVIGVVFARG